jgi:hypothetical protein
MVRVMRAAVAVVAVMGVVTMVAMAVVGRSVVVAMTVVGRVSVMAMAAPVMAGVGHEGVRVRDGVRPARAARVSLGVQVVTMAVVGVPVIGVTWSAWP